MFKKLYVFVLFILITSQTLWAQQDFKDLPTLKNKHILMVWGGWEGHKPKEFTDRVAKWLSSQGANVLIFDTLSVYTDSLLLAKQDLIIQYHTMGSITKDQNKGLLTAVKNGIGIAGCHGGLGDSFRQETHYQYMVGGQWVEHPGGKINYKVDITNQNDPVTAGLKDFDIQDTEQYFMHVDPNVKVLATTTFNDEFDSWIKGAVMPVSWKKYYGKGRVFYLSIGHNPKDFDNASAWALLTRGIAWASDSRKGPTEKWLSPLYPSHTKLK
ncbi:ThuA domain-containing protein [Namhaeicola litoreus]|uniref:ThuA domain-containing protein n=1 Tax=Namhaeicola litoreus TaxID=1052145 RepID=A0ABW3Y1T2_9FLAO